MSKEKLTVTKAWRVKSKPKHFLVEIEGKYYLLPIGATNLDNAIEPELQWATGMIENSEELDPASYWINDLAKKGGYDFKVGRAITPEELAELRERLNLTDDKVSEPFEDAIGKAFGEENTKTFKSIQIAVDHSKAIGIAEEIRKAGIEASNGSLGRVNIRIK